MRRQLTCIGLCFLGVGVAVLGFCAEFNTIKESEIQFFAPGKCTYPRTPAFALGLTAFLVLIVAHAIINASVGCISLNKLCSSYWFLFYAIISWVAFVIASVYLIEGLVLHDGHIMDEKYSSFCHKVLEFGIFENGALWGLTSVIFGVLYYRKNQTVAVNTDDHGNIGMTQP
ncbi:uncharacterized protein LOC113272937 [Papaver somniferum]|uniref:uncharacterized protein LOC113272937 n=1 Tax=Papaver somniferum TaxID=3469 RepID=UPI000E701759|nr:uncharacterized protein LOC113272937 [Papaver somniferum]